MKRMLIRLYYFVGGVCVVAMGLIGLWSGWRLPASQGGGAVWVPAVILMLAGAAALGGGAWAMIRACIEPAAQQAERFERERSAETDA